MKFSQILNNKLYRDTFTFKDYVKIVGLLGCTKPHTITKKGSVFYASNAMDDYIHKLYYYKNAGVREYWIVDPRRKTVTVNYFEGNNVNVQYSFDSTIKVNIYDDLLINFSDIAELLNM